MSTSLRAFRRSLASPSSRTALRNASFLGLRSFSNNASLNPNSQEHIPRLWVPTPMVTETIVFHFFSLLAVLADCLGRRMADARHIFPTTNGKQLYSPSAAAQLELIRYQERIICINGPVDETVSASIVAQLLFLEADAPERPISLYINTPGGAVTAGLAIYDTMTYITSPVTTTCVGQAASMGSLLLAGGAAGKRFCLPHSSIMLHQPSGGYFGQASDIAIHAKEILRVRSQLNEIYRRHLTKEYSIEEIEGLLDRDNFLSAEQAKEMGIVDNILDTRSKEGEDARKL